MASSSSTPRRYSARSAVVVQPEIYKKFLEDSIRRAELETHPTILYLLRIEDKIRNLLKSKTVSPSQRAQIVSALVAQFVETYRQRLGELTKSPVGDEDVDFGVLSFGKYRAPAIVHSHFPVFKKGKKIFTPSSFRPSSTFPT